jgi:hypothetical protein
MNAGILMNTTLDTMTARKLRGALWRNVWGIILPGETNQRFTAEHGQMGGKPFLHLIQQISGPHFHEIIEILAPFPLHLHYGTAFFKIFTNTAVAEDDING